MDLGTGVLFLLLATFSAGLLVVGGKWVIGHGAEPVAARRWLLYLLSVSAAFPLVIDLWLFVSNLRFDDISPIAFLGFFPLPALFGSLALAWVNLRAYRHLWPVDKRMLIFLVVFLFLSWMVPFNLNFQADWNPSSLMLPPLLLVVLIPGFFALIWYLGQRTGILGLIIGAAIILGWFLFIDRSLSVENLNALPAPLAGVVSFLRSTIPLLTLFYPAILAYRGIETKKPALILLAALMLVVISYRILWDTMWSTAIGSCCLEDRVYSQIIQVIPAIVAGMLLTISLPSKKSRIGFAYLVVLPLFMLALLWEGSRIPFEEITQNRANEIVVALERYRAGEDNSYPETLDQLRPEYMESIPNTLPFGEDGWCYTGGKDYYRLGYLDVRNRIVNVVNYASIGNPPEDNFCVAHSERLRQRLQLPQVSSQKHSIPQTGSIVVK